MRPPLRSIMTCTLRGSARNWGAGLSKVIKRNQHASARKSAGTRSFSCLKDILSHYGRTAPERRAILAPGRRPMTYGALWIQTREIVHGLRSIGVGRTDRVAVA